MVYRIRKTDGTEVTQIPDGRFDTSTSLTLFGKNVTSFGEEINENFVHLLENFASTSQPQQSVRGQLWYDTASGRLNVYDGNGYRVTGGPIVSPVRPALVTGDLWIDNRENQLYFYDGTDLILAGPMYSETQGVTGFKAETLIDRVTGQSRHVAALYVGGILLGIFSSADFTPLIQLTGFGAANSPISKGFNASTIIDFKFDVTASRAQALLLTSGAIKSAVEVAYLNVENVFTQPITVLDNGGLQLGNINQARVYLQGNDIVFENTIDDRDIFINVKQSAITNTAVAIKGVSKRLGIWNDTPQYDVDITGTLRVSGNFIVGGETVTLNTTTISTQDKNIELNKPEDISQITDLSANDGGIILKGTVDKTILYDDVNKSWDFSEHLNLAVGKKLKIDDTIVIEADPNQSLYPGEYRLGTNITSAPGLTRVGSLTQLNAGQVSITTNRISTPTNTNMELNMPGVGNLILTNNGQIKGISTPTDVQDAANKQYVDFRIYTKPLFLSLDITGYVLFTGDDDNAAISNILDVLAPYYDLADAANTPDGTAASGTKLYLHSIKTSIVTQPFTLLPGDYDYTYEQVISQDGISLTAVLSDVKINPFPAPSSVVNKTRRTKLFIMGGGTNPQIGRWGFDSDLGAAVTTSM